MLLVHGEREEAVAEAEHIAALMPQAEVRKMPGEAWEVDEMPMWAEEIRAFIGATRPLAGLDRVLATVLFTDIVGSTQCLAEMGDAAWRSILGSHDERARAKIGLHRGRHVDSTGDGLFATFDGPARAVLCAQAIGHAGR